MAMLDSLKLGFLRFAASGWIPKRWFASSVPAEYQVAPKHGPLTLEVVSHCWHYSHLLVYQLSSIVNSPPQKINIVVTIFYSLEDGKTREVLDFFQRQKIPNVSWKWCPLKKQELFRRAIGRNKAALSTDADWIWFTDCDVMFGNECLDTLATELEGRRSILLFPEKEWTTDLLDEDDPVFIAGDRPVTVLDIDTRLLHEHRLERATGPMQIVHGDVCREFGYCRAIPLYQKPVSKFAKCHEDRAFRWLLGSSGQPLKVPGVYRIRHIKKGRYGRKTFWSRIRTALRVRQSTRQKSKDGVSL